MSLEYLTLSDLETGEDVAAHADVDPSRGAMLSGTHSNWTAIPLTDLRPHSMAGAIRNGKTRLIDNVLLK